MTVACCWAQSLLVLSDGRLACLGAAREVRASDERLADRKSPPSDCSGCGR